MSSPPQESPASSADETRQHATTSATPGLFHEARNQQEAHPQVTSAPTLNAASSTVPLVEASATSHVDENVEARASAGEQKSESVNSATKRPSQVETTTGVKSPAKNVVADSRRHDELLYNVGSYVASKISSFNQRTDAHDRNTGRGTHDAEGARNSLRAEMEVGSGSSSIPAREVAAESQVIATRAVPENSRAAARGSGSKDPHSAAASTAMPAKADGNAAAVPKSSTQPEPKSLAAAAPGSLGTEAEARKRLYLTIAITYMASLSFGCSVAYSSPALPSIRKSMEFSSTESDWFGSLAMLGAVLGGLGGGRQLNVIGRRGTLIASSLWFMLGWTCLVVATPKAALFVGRLLTGVGTGIAALTVSVFISEISPANLRGQLNTGANLILCSGILTVFVLGKFLSFWLLAACCLIPAAAMSVALFWCHESPRWLLKNNQRRSAVAALRFYFGPGAASELATLEAALSRMHGTAGFSLPDLTSRRVYRAFLCVLLIMSMQQLSGISVIITFTQDIFEDAGTTVSPEDAAIILAFIQVVMVGVATVLADRVGRKILLMFSTTVSSVCLGALGMSFNLKASVGDSFKETYGWLPLTSLGLFFVGYSVGLGPLPWVILGEMIPLKARAFATGTCTAFLFAEAFCVSLSYNGYRHVTELSRQTGGFRTTSRACMDEPSGSCSAQQLGILTNPLGSLTNTGSRLNPVNLGTRAWDQTFGKITNTSASDISKQLTENAIPGVRHRVITDVPLGGHVLAEIFQNSSGNVIDCNLLGDKALIEGVLVVLP
ncbi:hypothetical protein MTO96_012113 [Rhipicephalus appendiculatus]